MTTYQLYKKLQGILNDSIAKGHTYFEDDIIKFVPWPLNTNTQDYRFESILNIETDVQTSINFNNEDFDILILYNNGKIFKITDSDLEFHNFNYYENLVKIYGTF
ncbi:MULTISPECIES: hypothetical protein [Chryseobacterium]|uniref:Phage protein n=1 Tax=Chryseobacterium camelliae TaxID=1265445 RepID=A0ABU0THY3_9FLAO|nr:MULTISPECIES: hypothetical protein [Chryseobacterium]MDT3409466.1 hypothetical protein [Pseudacidovorax intermedius]MDQ1096669.1 hypothetical protein [Chryseobacterium camelliae]MDQ1100613.1 hypothetical protein [Chryseobacterium sp. SORGH_AS_1048]MDR6087951.1 hypothetical protein [Chryseobacterium sp. SORGH_AS_0909]MDR6132325.1 hypothetical protein [Chryseobacterium sp. SORGH_AS_1175]